ncbi:hypothetical protein FRB91_011880 [Serendipita sp. 411]|nr:hypothetical protein FRB91_011880 [Serendipita sp. 411]
MNIDDKHLQPPSSITRIVDDSASDDEMVTATSNITPLVPAEKLDSAAPSQMPGGNDSMLSVDQNTEQNLGHGEIAPQGEIPATQPSMDLLDRIKGMYRLLDLVNDTAIGGSVDKVVIAQESIESLANTIQPNSYSSMTKVDFRALDKHAIRPQGVYGSKSSIVGFFEELGRLNAETRSLLLAPRDEASGTNRPFMRPGLYLVDAREADRDLFYVVFWPEETTWDDDAGSSVSRNRVTFMRYLKKLCDQLVCLISEEHAQNLVWGDEGTEGNVDDDIEDDDVNERLYAFSVEQTQSQEDSASVHEGFSFQHHSISVSNACNLPAGISSEQLLPRIVVGEQAQGILRVEYNHGEYGRSKVNMKRTRKAMINYLKSDQTPQIQLGEHITRDSLSVLLELGLGTRCGDIEASWVAQCAEESDKRASSIEDRRKADIAKVDETMRKFRASLKIWLPNQASSFFPSLSEEALIASLMEEGSPQQIGAEERNDAIRDVENTLSFASWRQNAVSSLENKLKRISEASGPDYRDIKTRCLEIRFILENSTLDEKVAQQFLDLLFSEGNFESLFNNLCASVSSSSATANQGDGIARKMWTTASSWLLGTPGKRQLVLKKMPATASIPNDISFWKSLERDARLNPAYNEAKELVGNHLIHEIKNTLIYVRNEITQKVRSVISRQMTAIREKDFEEGRKVELDDAWNRLRERMRSFFAPKIDATRSCLQITQITRETGGNRHVEESFRLIGWEIKPRLADFRYTFFPMEIKAEDLQQVSMNADHICKPGISEHRKQTFEIRVGTTLQLFRLIGKDGCIVVLQDRDSLRIFYDSLSGISNAIEKDRHKKLLHLIRIGHESLIAVEETRRHLALLSRKSGSLQINLYSYDEVSKTLASRGSAVDISEWYPGRIPSFRDFHFIPNTDELLLVEAGGMSRVFSLMTQTFRSKKVLLGPNLLSVSVTFDGASLLALYKGEDSTLQLRCLHWASFGEQPGIQLPVPAWASSSKSVALSSVGNRKNNQLIFLDPDQSQISSLFIKISCKSSAFTFKANKHDTEHVKRRVTVNNSLIDCHADVWTRFPIAPPIRRELSTQAIARPSTIHFVSKWPIPMLEAYFRTMVTDFESKTRKPTDGILHKIQVSTAAQWSPHGLNKEITVSQLGDWLVGLMCLIPIHLAVTGSNRFIPLKDGVNNNEFEGQLLGASVMQIVQK